MLEKSFEPESTGPCALFCNFDLVFQIEVFNKRLVCLGLMRSCTKILTVKMGGRNQVEMARTRCLEKGVKGRL